MRAFRFYSFYLRLSEMEEVDFIADWSSLLKLAYPALFINSLFNDLCDLNLNVFLPKVIKMKLFFTFLFNMKKVFEKKNRLLKNISFHLQYLLEN